MLVDPFARAVLRQSRQIDDAKITRLCQLTVLAGLLFISTTAPATPVQIHVRMSGPSAQGASVPIEVHITGGVAGKETQTRTFPVDRGTVDIELTQPGVWYVTPRAPGYWGETRTLVTPLKDARLDVELWPAVTLQAELSPRSRVKQVILRFQPVAANGLDERSVPPAGAADCKVEKMRVTCIVPAGRMDYSLRSFGYIPQYRWDQILDAGAVVDLGRLEFRRGASLIGRVAMPTTTPRQAEVQARVTLTPQGLPPTTASETARASMRIARTITDRRGRFVLEGVPPGGYLLSAAASGLISEQREIVIIEGLEAELREPLALTVPLTLTVTVDPPTDPWRGAWTLELLRLRHESHVATLVDTASPDAEGRWNVSDLIPGVYMVKVRRTQGVWHSEMVSLSESGAVSIAIPVVKAAGELLLGDTPIPGSIWFGGEFGEISVPVTTDKQGIFRAFLPAVKDNLWEDVDVVAERPPVRASLKNVRLAGPNSKGITTVDIVLPANRLYGEVTTKEGVPVSPAFIYADPRGGGTVLQLEADEAGAFAFNGLTPGTYSVRAIGPVGKSKAIQITIEPNSDQYLRILVEKDVAIEGTVSSEYGVVAGARVSVYPEERTGFGILPWDRTDSEGRFRVPVSPHQRNMTMTVAAPGFAFKIFELPAEPARPLTIHVQQGGGQLITTDEPDPSHRTYLFRGQTFLPVAALEAAGTARRDGAQVVIENLEPGHYDACITDLQEAPVLARAVRPKERCVGGFLAPSGTLDLQPRAP